MVCLVAVYGRRENVKRYGRKSCWLGHKSARIYGGLVRIGLFTLKKSRRRRSPLGKKRKSDSWHPSLKLRQLMPRGAKGWFFLV